MSKPDSVSVDLNPPPYRELTWAAVIFGVLIGAVMTAAFSYVALKLGFTLSGSTVAAILGLLFFAVSCAKVRSLRTTSTKRWLLGVNTASAGVAFTLPALFIMGEDFNVWSVIVAAIAGSFWAWW